MIGVDWGTTSLRAWRYRAGGTVLESRAAARGIMTVTDGGFEAVLREAVGDWLAAGESRVILCGMIGSRQGWVEAPYVPCPAGPAELAAAAVPIPFAGAELRLIPGLTARDAFSVPEVIRGEETKIVGLLPGFGSGAATVCLPGTHAKWVRVDGGRVVGFATYMTGEVFGALSQHTILGRMMNTDAPRRSPSLSASVARLHAPAAAT